MSNPVCLAVSRIDKTLADINWLNAHQIAQLRSVYQTITQYDITDAYLKNGKTFEELTLQDFMQMKQELKDFHEALSQKDKNRLSERLYNPISALNQLEDAFSPIERNNRVGLVADKFTEVIDDLQKEFPGMSRTELIQGTYDTEGNFIGGPSQIFKRVGDKIKKQRDYYDLVRKQPKGDGKISRQECFRRYKQYALTLQNLGSLVVLANRTIRETEGFNIANKMHFAVPSTIEDYDEYGLSFEFNSEEELRESYQIHKDNINPFTSVAAPVRRLLGTIRDFANIASPQYYDDLGNEKRGNVSSMHIQLMALFRGVKSQQDILNRLEKCDENEYPYKAALQKAFKDNPLLLTQFYCDFSKATQLYAKMAWGKDGLFMLMLNKKTKKALRKAIIAKIKSKDFLQTPNTIYYHNSVGGIVMNKEKVKDALDFLLGEETPTGRDGSKGILAKSYFNADGTKITAEQYEKDLADDTILEEVKADYAVRYTHVVSDLNDKNTRELLFNKLKLATEYFGMYFDVNSFISLISDLDRLESFLDNLSQLAYALGEVQRRNISDFNQAIDITTGSESNSSLLKDALGSLYMQITSQEEIDAILPRATYMGKGYFSYVQSSQMSSFVDDIKNCFSEFKILNKSEAMNIIDTYLGNSKRFIDPITGEYTPGFIREIKSGKKKITKDALMLKLNLLNKFGYSSFYYDKENDRFNNQWLNDMYFGKTSKKNCFSRMLSVFRLLGDDNKKFEDFAEQSQLTSNLSGFFSNPNKGFGYFPTFILGDSGIQKFIQAPMYKEGVIIRGLVDAALRDIELYGELVAQKHALENQFEAIFASESNLPTEPAVREAYYKKRKAEFLGDFGKISTENIFALVPMLNNKELSSNAKIKEVILKLNNAKTTEEIEAVKQELYSSNITALLEDDIKASLLSGFSSFIKNIKADGLLDYRHKAGTKNEEEYANSIIRKLDSSYKNADYCGTIASSIYKKDNNNLYNNLWDYYLNHKYATVNQVEVFVESPAFFKKGLDGVSVDFQKRYKMIHTNGTRLAPDARWAYGKHKGELFSEDFHRTVVYVADPYTDTKLTDPGFYNALKEYDRINETDLASKYTIDEKGKGGVKSADGQSWVTYECYMATMGMNGKMTKELADMNDKIEDIRASIKEWQQQNPFTETDENRLNELIQERIEKLKNGEKWEETSEYRKLLERKNGINLELSKALEECRVALMPIKSFISTFENIPNNAEGYNMIPVQIKHSECVVFPELLPKGSKLREMMEWAEQKTNGKPNADMISSSESIKVGLFGSANIHECKEAGSITQSLSTAYKHKISNTGYIIQQNNSDHINQERAVGTQGRKIVMANIDMEGDYARYLGDVDSFVLNGETISDVTTGSDKTGFTGKAINQLYVSLNVSNILEDLNKFKAKMADVDMLRDNLIQAASSSERGISENILSLAPSMELDENGKPKQPFVIPLFEGGNANDIAAYLLSMFRKQVNHQMMAGGSAIQASAYGINDYSEDENLQYQVDPYNSANILYAETEIPFDLKYTDANGDIVELDRDDYCYGDGSLKLSDTIIKYGEPNYEKYLSWKLDKNDPHSPVVVPLIELEFPGILDLIVSRIPTEEKYSMMPLKVTKFSRKVAGGGIIRLPLHTVTIAGFDFDIDKLYIQRKEFKYKPADIDDETLGEYWLQFYNSESREALYEELKSRRKYSSGSDDKSRLYEYADNPSKLKREFTKWFKENIGALNGEFETYNFKDEPNGPTQTRVGRNNLLFDLMYARLTDYETMEERFTPGGFDSIKEARSYILGLKGLDRDTAYDYSDPYTLIMYNQQNQVAAKLIGIFANQNANAAISSLIARFQLNEKIAFGSQEGVGLDDLKNKKSKVRETLASAVDAVKEPCLKDLNITMTTASSACILARLGYSYEDIGLLFNQPAIVEITKQAANTNTFNITSLIKEKLIELSGTEDYKKIDSSGLTTEILEESIKFKAGQVNSINNYEKNQIKALKLFLQVYEAASELNDFVGNTGFTRSNSVKSNFGGMYAQQNNVWKYIEESQKGDRLISIDIDGNGQSSPIVDGLNTRDSNYMKEVTKNPFGYEQAQYDACREFLESLKDYFPYESMASIRRVANSVIKGKCDDSIIEVLHKVIIKDYIDKYIGSESDFNPNATREFKGEIYDNYTYFTKIVPIKIAYFKYTNEKASAENGLLSLLVEDADENDNLIIKFRDNGSLISEQKETITAGWKQLVKEGLAGIEMAKELYMYNYYMSGSGFGAIGFNHLAPVSVKMLLGDGKYLPAHYNLLNETDSSLFDSVNLPKLLEAYTIACKNAYQVVYSVPNAMFDLMKEGRIKGDTKGANENVPRIYDTIGDNSKITIDPSVEAWDPFFISRAGKDDDAPNVFRAGFTIKDGDKTYLYVCDNPVSFNVLPKGQAMTYKLVTEQEEKKLDPVKVMHNGDILDFGSYDSSLKGDALKQENIATARRVLETCNAELGLNIDIDKFIQGKFESTEEEAMHEDFKTFKAMVCKECTKKGFKGQINGEDIC